MLIAHYLKAADEAALWTALEAAGLSSKQYDHQDPLNVKPEDAADDWQPTGVFAWVKSDGYDLDTIGEIFKPTGDTDADGNPVMEQLDGYHANIRKWEGDFSDEQLAALPTIAKPTNPVRIWAGDL